MDFFRLHHVLQKQGLACLQTFQVIVSRLAAHLNNRTLSFLLDHFDVRRMSGTDGCSLRETYIWEWFRYQNPTLSSVARGFILTECLVAGGAGVSVAVLVVCMRSVRGCMQGK